VDDVGGRRFQRKDGRAHKGASFIDPMGAFCDGRLCQYKSGSAYYFVDYGHFSREGSMRAVEAYFPWMAQHRGVCNFISEKGPDG
jgi:hypothetical protein